MDRDAAGCRRGMYVLFFLVLLLSPSGARAAAIVNGDFESGSLAGWFQKNSGDPKGSWFAYSGALAPLSGEFPRPVEAPPQGAFAAITDQAVAGTHILYQDVALEPNATHILSMTAYYYSGISFAIPNPDSLAYNASSEGMGAANQQYRIDLMKPTAPIESLAPSDIYRTLLRTNKGDSTLLPPTPIIADLTPFAGQTIRLRLAEVSNGGYLNAGVDSVAIASVLPVTPPSNAFEFGTLRLNREKGIGSLQVKLPGAGTVTAVDVRSTAVHASAHASLKRPNRIKRSALNVASSEVISLPLRPTAFGRKTLKRKGNLKFKLLITFSPKGGTAASQTFAGKLSLLSLPRIIR